jgi:hypothetical protein
MPDKNRETRRSAIAREERGHSTQPSRHLSKRSSGARTDEGNAPNGVLSRERSDQLLEGLARELAAFPRPSQFPTRRRIDRGELARVIVFEHRNDEQIGLYVQWGLGNDGQCGRRRRKHPDIMCERSTSIEPALTRPSSRFR